jgi:predicted ATPase
MDLFQRLLRFEAHETPHAKFEKLEYALSQYRLPLEETVPFLAPLLALSVPEHRYPSPNLSSQRQRQKTLETLVAILLELAERQPVLFILEDLHWTDPSTLELLGLLLDQTPTASLLVLLTCRTHFQPAWHHRSYLTEMTVHRLSQAQVAQVVNRMTAGKTFPPEVLAQVVEKTDGVPLFVEELTKALLDSGQLQALHGHYACTGSVSAFAIPATLHDSLMARLDHLVTAKAVAQYAAVIGRGFAYDVLAMVSQLDAATLQRELDRLVAAEIVYQRGVPPRATYTFKHALIQEAAYESLLKSTRQRYHQRIAQVLEAQFPETTQTQPELLAHHSMEAGLSAQAVSFWYQAGQHASQRSAHVEAVAHLTHGLEVLSTLPETPERIRQELALQIALGPMLMVTRGYGSPEVERVYSRARVLSQQVEETAQLFPVLWGLWQFYLATAAYQTSHELGQQLLSLAQGAHDPALLLMAHDALGTTLLFQGALASSLTHFEAGIALYDPQQHRALATRYAGEDPGVVCRGLAALTLWFLGYPDQALTRIQDALRLAHELAHLNSLTETLGLATWVHQFRGETQRTYEQATATITSATEQGFATATFEVWGTLLRGWALAAQGQHGEGIAQMQQGLAACRAIGAEVLRPFSLALLAEAYGKAGQNEAGLALLAEVATTGEHLYEPELYRLKGQLTLALCAAHHADAETCLRQALNMTQRQEAKSLELRAAMSLSRLWQRQGKRAAAHALLAPIYGWFTEGFDTADLQEAKALLEELAG